MIDKVRYYCIKKTEPLEFKLWNQSQNTSETNELVVAKYTYLSLRFTNQLWSLWLILVETMLHTLLYTCFILHVTRSIHLLDSSKKKYFFHAIYGILYTIRLYNEHPFWIFLFASSVNFSSSLKWSLDSYPCPAS